MGGGFGGGGMFGGGPGGGGRGAFDQTYKCFPSSFHAVTKSTADPESYESSDKILLPPSALQTLAQLHIEYPMLFELIPHNGGKRLHCGVLEFVAQEGQMFIPFWMMENMQLEEGDLLTVRNACLDKGSYVKFRPQSKAFIELANPRAVLERTLAKYSCLTKNETIRIFYNERTYDIDVVELKSARGPAEAVSIIEADVNVDFDAPADYVEPNAAPAGPVEVFIPDTEFSQAAARGFVSIPKAYHLESREDAMGEGRLLGKQKKKKKKVAAVPTFKGVLSQGPLVEDLMQIGEYAPEGSNSPFDFNFDSQLAQPEADQSTFEGSAGTTLRSAKSK